MPICPREFIRWQGPRTLNGLSARVLEKVGKNEASGNDRANNVALGWHSKSLGHRILPCHRARTLRVSLAEIVRRSARKIFAPVDELKVLYARTFRLAWIIVIIALSDRVARGPERRCKSLLRFRGTILQPNARIFSSFCHLYLVLFFRFQILHRSYGETYSFSVYRAFTDAPPRPRRE